MHLDENGFVVEDGLVAADADEAVSEHFVKVGAVGEFGKSAENLLADFAGEKRSAEGEGFGIETISFRVINAVYRIS